MAQKDGNALRHFGIAFLLAVLLYVALFKFIEHRRVSKGPWLVTFVAKTNAAPELIIQQDALKIHAFRVRFGNEQTSYATNETVRFETARPVPFEVPFGHCVFLDTSFLPGTVTLRCFDREIELLPRGIIVNHELHSWTNAGLEL